MNLFLIYVMFFIKKSSFPAKTANNAPPTPTLPHPTKILSHPPPPTQSNAPPTQNNPQSHSLKIMP